MKGNLRNPRPIAGLSIAIIENKYLEFWVDIINHRHLEENEFFKYIKKYGKISEINRKIEYISYHMSSIKANQIKLIIDYKRAMLEKDNMKIENLKDSFNKITSVKLVSDNYVNNNKTINYDLPSEEFNKDEVNNLINDFLKGKGIPENKLESLRERIRKHLKDLDYKTVNDFNIKLLNIDIVSKDEINQIIEVLNYFIINVQNNIVILDDLYSNYMLFLSDIKELSKENKILQAKKVQLESKKENNLIEIKNKLEKTEKEIKEISKKITKEELEMTKCGELIKNFMPEVNDKLCDAYKNNISRLYISKSAKLKNYLKNYRIVLEYLVSFKNKVENNEDFEDFSSKLKHLDLEEDYIKDIIDNARTIIRYYKNMNKYNLTDKKLEDMKKDYISKVYKPNN